MSQLKDSAWARRSGASASISARRSSGLPDDEDFDPSGPYHTAASKVAE